MSGHNKWSKIKHKKESTDTQKSKVFGKFAQLIAAESKKCGGDKNSPGLKSVIEQAKAVNMTSQNIQRAIEKGSGVGGAALEAITYEAYGPGGCALLIETRTDNRNRSAAEIRHVLTKHGHVIGSPGSAAWMFTKKDGTHIPNTTIQISESDKKKLETLNTALYEQGDIDTIYTNEI